MVYDAGSDRLVVFGGDAFTPTKFDDTWTVDPGTGAWMAMDAERRLPARTYFAMTCDEATDRVVVFGGYGAGDIELDDTWAYDLNTDTWELLSRHGGPGPRGYVAMADDPAAPAGSSIPATSRGRFPTGQMCTAGHVKVRLIPSTPWMRETTILPKASMLAAWTSAMMSYGPVTTTAELTPWIAPTSSATAPVLPDSVWISTKARTITLTPR